MVSYREYLDYIGERQKELERHDKDGLVALLLNLESIFLYEVGRGDIGDADCEEDRRDILFELRDFVRYQKIKKSVGARVDRDFYPDDDRARQQLIETVTHLVIEITGTENS